MFVLHNLHVQPTGVHCLMLSLNSFNASDFLIESGKGAMFFDIGTKIIPCQILLLLHYVIASTFGS